MGSKKDTWRGLAEGAVASAFGSYQTGSGFFGILAAYVVGGWIGLFAGVLLSLVLLWLREDREPIPNNLSTFSDDELRQLEGCRLPVRTSLEDTEAVGTFVRLKGRLAEVEWDRGGVSLVPLKDLAITQRGYVPKKVGEN